MKFYNNNSYILIDIKKESNINAMSYCRYNLKGRCRLQGKVCSQLKKCKYFIHVNSSEKDVKLERSNKGVDYSKSYCITIYEIYSYTENKNKQFYISNKEYEIDSCQKVDASSNFASVLRGLKLNQEFQFGGQKYRLEKLFKNIVTKNKN